MKIILINTQQQLLRPLGTNPETKGQTIQKAAVFLLRQIVVVSARQAHLSMSKTTDLLGFSHTPISGEDREWSKEEQQLCG